MSEYEVVECRKSGKELADYEIRIKGAGKGTPKVATVWGHYGTDAKTMALKVATALSSSQPEARREVLDSIRQIIHDWRFADQNGGTSEGNEDLLARRILFRLGGME